MANLTDYLSAPTGVKPVIPTAVPAPDYLGMANNVVRGYLGAQPTAADKRAQASAELSAREQAAMSELAGGVFEALETPPKEIRDHADKIVRMRKAGSSAISIDAEIQAAYKRVVAKYPEFQDKYFDWLTKNGVDDFMFRQPKADLAAEKSEEKAVNDAFLGFSEVLTKNGYDVTTMSRPEIIFRGGQINKRLSEFTEATAIASEARAVRAEDRAVRSAARDESSERRTENTYNKNLREDSLVDAVLNGVGVTRGAAISTIHKLAIDAAGDPAKEKLYREEVQRALIGSSQDRMRARQEVSGVDSAQLARVDEYFDQEEKLLKSLLSEDMSSNFRLAETIKAAQQGNVTEAYTYMPNIMFWIDVFGQAGVASVLESFEFEEGRTSPLQKEVADAIIRRGAGKTDPSLERATPVIKTPTVEKLGELKEEDPKAYNYTVTLGAMTLPGAINQVMTNPSPEANRVFANALLPVVTEAANMPATLGSSVHMKTVVRALPPGQTILAINAFQANGGDPYVADSLKAQAAKAYFSALQAGLRDYQSEALGSMMSPMRGGSGALSRGGSHTKPVVYNEATGVFEGGEQAGLFGTSTRKSSQAREAINNLNLLLGATVALEKERGVIPKGMSELTARKFLVDGVGGYQKMVDEISGVTTQVDSWNSSISPVQVMFNQQEIAEQAAKDKGISMVKKPTGTTAPKKTRGSSLVDDINKALGARSEVPKDDPFYAELEAISKFNTDRLTAKSKFSQNNTVGVGANINIKGLDSSKISPRIEEYVPIIQQRATQYNVPQELIIAMMDQESRGQKDAVSSAGAQGLMQLMPETAKELGVTDPFDPEQNIDGGVRYMSQKLAAFDGDVELALMSYNWGESRVKRWVENGRTGAIPEETRDYVEKILGRLQYD